MEWYSNLDLSILIIDSELGAKTAGGIALREIIRLLKDLDFDVVEATTIDDAFSIFRSSYPEIAGVLLDWDLQADAPDAPGPAEMIREIRTRNRSLPIFLFTRKLAVNEIPLEVVRTIDGYFWKLDNTPRFIAGRIEDVTGDYLDTLLPAFFGELVRYTQEYTYAWHTPGHTGGAAFLKSPVGKLFYEFFGENTLRADLSVSVPELGSLLEHSGVVGDAEADAARIFGADRTYFVTNGTSTANKIVFSSCVSPGDIVLVDRNCHKSVMYAIILTGAVPVYLVPTRNNYGIIGPIPASEFSEDAILEKIRSNRLAQPDAAPKLAVITNSTYDGLCYDVVAIRGWLRGMVDALHFDEAWYGYACVHPLYEGRYAMSGAGLGPDDPVLYATQSTHKVLAAFSQASMVHILDGHRPEDGRVDPERFNEAFMMHSSTSPAYSIIASLDVAAKMMEGDSGTALIADTLEEALIFRQKMVQIGEQLAAGEEAGERWWFGIWQPEGGDFPDLRPRPEAGDDLERHLAFWTLRPGDAWHGFEGLDEGYVLLDPLKVTVLTPGVEKDGGMGMRGIPAPVVSRFLQSRGIVVEKSGFYSFLILFTMGISRGKSGTLIAQLFEFKDLYDENAPLERVFPALTRAHPEIYGGMGLADLCDAMHAYLRRRNIAGVLKTVYAGIPEAVMTPAEAYRHLVAGETETVPIGSIIGRTAAVMVVPYPPGIPVLMPGERVLEEDRCLVNFLLLYGDFDTAFPGFETEIHGVVSEQTAEGKVVSVLCLKEDG
ncbi:MAG: Orn/Lys/Arg decarboxylase N-terminal domain-containing protein [Methanofollis sp.]|uniref:Orn/Lys/Arg family decarboxylase n=1 Tax=Methanofollis sp. TaxID=2052835 RepID=UPI0026266F63|nr:Orn/Lys/Arg decarboxylase N-terminal domain-containing protein [Methanofollis sp.]MDD4256028.1 Orn/Lys/Arg decarboxylase N-terminal domain-containing protein [Methanofollis sp.]